MLVERSCFLDLKKDFSALLCKSRNDKGFKNMNKYIAIILAAGKGTRMNEGLASSIPKVMFEIADKPIISWSVKLVKDAGIEKVILVIGYKKELIEQYFGDQVEYAIQAKQLGTGHAVLMAKDLAAGKSNSVIVFYGDCPLYKPETVKKLIEYYENPPADGEKPTIAMLTAISMDAGAYGRVIRDEKGDVASIVEYKDCNEEQKKVGEWNPGFYIFDADWLWQNIVKLQNNNAQNEYYLTDLIMMAKEQNKRVIAMPVSEESEAMGINTPEQQKEAEKILLERKNYF